MTVGGPRYVYRRELLVVGPRSKGHTIHTLVTPGSPAGIVKVTLDALLAVFLIAAPELISGQHVDRFGTPPAPAGPPVPMRVMVLPPAAGPEIGEMPVRLNDAGVGAWYEYAFDRVALSVRSPLRIARSTKPWACCLVTKLSSGGEVTL